MADLPAGVDADEIDGRGLSAVPGLVDCHTHACFAGDRVNEFSLRAGGASYEELHAAGGGILSTVALDASGGRGRARSRDTCATEAGCAPTARRRSRASRATASIATPSSRSFVPSVPPAAIPTWLGAHTVPPEFGDADAYLDFALAEVLPDAALARRGGGRLSRAGLVRRRSGTPLPGGLSRRGAGVAPARRPVHGVGRDRARDRARRPLGRPPRGDGDGRSRPARRQRCRPASCFLRARSSSDGRCLLRARSSTPAR